MEKIQEIETERKAKLRRSRVRNNNLDRNRRYQKSSELEEDRESVESEPSVVYLYIALVFAIFKDIIDFVGLGSIPLVGTLITLLVTGTIGFMMILSDASSTNKIAKKAAKKIITLIVGGAVEAFAPGVNLFPIQTLTVIIIIILTKLEHKGILKIPKTASIKK